MDSGSSSPTGSAHSRVVVSAGAAHGTAVDPMRMDAEEPGPRAKLEPVKVRETAEVFREGPPETEVAKGWS